MPVGSCSEQELLAMGMSISGICKQVRNQNKTKREGSGQMSVVAYRIPQLSSRRMGPLTYFKVTCPPGDKAARERNAAGRNSQFRKGTIGQLRVGIFFKY
jgi:hypothetical protein